jgi:octaprenyl-diphosphate synthase
MAFDWIPSETAAAVDALDLSLSVRSVPEMDALLSRTVLFRGKKFRPMLCFLVAQWLGLDLKQVAPYARAAEFVHAATLAHDDVIDESPIRRNRPTLNARSSNARAVLAGDLLLARVMAELSALGRIEIIQDLSQTVEALVTGEWLQLEARGVVQVDRNHLETVSKLKTASLMAWACVTPAHLASQAPEVRDALGRFGECLGIAFQMIDDIIDYDAKGGKPVGQDLREGLVNFVTLELLEAQPAWQEPVQKLLGDPEGSSSLWPWSEAALQEACQRVRGRTQAKLEAAEFYLNQVAGELARGGGALLPQDSGSSKMAFQALGAILTYLKERVR